MSNSRLKHAAVAVLGAVLPIGVTVPINSPWSFNTRRMLTAVLTSWLLSGASPATAQTAAWQAVSPAPAVMAQIAIGPSGSGIVYIGTFGGGVLKSRDDGRSFQPFNNGLNDASVSAMTAHPTDIDHLYVGTFSGGIYRTTNGGANWTLVTVAATPSPIFAIAIDPVRPSTIYVGSFGSPLLRKSTDAGATWTDANRGLPSGAPVWTIQIDPRNPDVLFAGTGGGGAFKSINGGATWTPLSVASTVFALAIDPQESDTIYAGTDGGGVYRSFDGGEHFAREISPGNGRVLSLALDRARRGAVYAGTLGGGVAVSLDFAQTFTATSLARGFALALSINDRGEVYAGTNSAGVFRSGSYGVVWSPVAADALSEIKAQNIYGLTIDPTNPARLLAATNQSGMIETADAGRTWQEASTGLTSRSPRRPVFDPSDNMRVYAGSLPGGGLFVSSDRGRTWTSRVFGAPNIYVWALGVASDRTVYAGTVGEGLWRSSDLGASFTRIAGTPFIDVRSVVADPSDSRRIVSGGPQGFYRSIDGGCFISLKPAILL